jgi:gamma-glutamylcyclotransferase (GGCT)/AIG2-like uncharacterized protein YtfP
VHRVFVYGSLKRGFGNNSILGNSEFLGERITADNHYRMISFGAFPGVIFSKSAKTVAKVFGELYVVNDYVLKRLDMLEGNGNFYQRELVSLIDEEHPAWMYLLVSRDYPYNSLDTIDRNGEKIFKWR